MSDLQNFQVASDGHRVFVLDHAVPRVYVFDMVGRLVDSLGRKGSGPGELEYPLALDIHHGVVAVVDLGARRIVRWDLQNNLLDPIPVRDGLDHPKMLLRSGRLLYTIQATSTHGGAEYQLVAADAEGKQILASLPKQPRRIASFPACNSHGMSVQPLFAPTIIWDASDDLTASVVGPDYLVELLAVDGSTRRVTRPISPIRATAAMAEREAASWVVNRCVVPPPEVVREAGYMPTVPVIQSLALSPSNDLWIFRRDSTARLGIDVFDSSGAYLGALPHEAPFPAAFMSDSQLIAVERDSMDVPQVVVYRVKRS